MRVEPHAWEWGLQGDLESPGPLSREDTAKRRSSRSQDTGPHQTPNLLVPFSWTSSLQTVGSKCLLFKPLTCVVLFSSPKWTKTLMRVKWRDMSTQRPLLKGTGQRGSWGAACPVHWRPQSCAPCTAGQPHPSVDWTTCEWLGLGTRDHQIVHSTLRGDDTGRQMGTRTEKSLTRA